MNLVESYLNEEQLYIWAKSNLENSSKKADYIIYGDYDYKNLSNISQLENEFPNETKNYNYGDLVALSQYRDSKTYIIGKNGNLIENPDYSRSGYLTIPLEITRYLDDACEKYKEINVSELYLRHDDKFIIDNIGYVDSSWNFKYIINTEETDKLVVIFSNMSSKTFDIEKLNASLIFNYYENSLKKQGSFLIKFKIQNDDYDRFIAKNNQINKTPDVDVLFWNTEIITCGGGGKTANSTIKFSGPEDYYTEVLEIIKDFYEGFNIQISKLNEFKFMI